MTEPSTDARAADAAAASTPVACMTMRSARARSFAFVARTSTMRLPCTLPSRTIAIVEMALSTSFCAVPPFSRVEPGDDLGADDGLDREVGGGADREPALQAKPDGERADAVARTRCAPST